MEADTGKIERKKVSIKYAKYTVRKVYSTQSKQYTKYSIQYTQHIHLMASPLAVRKGNRMKQKDIIA